MSRDQNQWDAPAHFAGFIINRLASRNGNIAEHIGF